MKLFKNAVIVAESGTVLDGYLLENEGKILVVGPGEPSELPEDAEIIDCGGKTLVPGFVEIHSHGGGGYDVADGTDYCIIGTARAHLVHGTTTYVPSSSSCPDEELFDFLERFKDALKVKENVPRLPGVHLEGPYLSGAQAGAQAPAFLKAPTKEHVLEVYRHGGGNIIRISAAPELPGAMWLGDFCREHGIVAAIAHSDADYEVVKESIRHGYTHVTHLYSGMSLLTRRKGFRILGVLESAFLFDELSVELITDGKHLPPELLRLIFKIKPHDKISLISDSMRGADMPEGPSYTGSRDNGVKCIIKDGVAFMPDFSCFTGSVATGDRLLRVAVREAGLPLEEAVRMISLNPARLHGLDGTIGSIRRGKAADLVLIDDDFKPHGVWVGGKKVTL